MRPGDQLVALRGIVVRDLRQMWRYRAGYIMMLASAVVLPLLYHAQAIGFAGGSGAARESFNDLSGTDEVAGFIYLGWAVLMWVSVILYGPATALRTERLRGTLEMILLSPVPRRTLLLGSAVAPLVPTVVMFTVVLLFMRTVMGVRISGSDLGVFLVVIVVSTPALMAVGMVLSSLTFLTRDSDGAVTLAQGAVSVLCGVTYPIAVLPQALQWVSQALPPTQTILLLRSGVLGEALTAEAGVRVAYLVAVAAVLVVVSDLTLRRALAHGRRTGRLGQW